MNLFYFLIRESWRTMVLAAAAGTVSGVCSMAMIGMIHTALRKDHGLGGKTAAWAFGGLVVATLISRLFTQYVMTRLSQGAVSRLRLYLCGRILDVPLRRLEEIGQHRLLSVLTGDLNIIVGALNDIPSAVVNLVILLCGIGYLAWLAPWLLVALLGVMALAIPSYLILAKVARRYLRSAREEQDNLLRHIRTLIKGVKELKLVRARREALLDRELAASDEALRKYQRTGQRIQSANVGLSRLMFLVAIGGLIFVWPRYHAVDKDVLNGYALAVLYLMSPLTTVVTWVPTLGRARIALDKINELGLSLSSEPPAAAGEEPLPTAVERIDLVGVTHRYGHERDEKGFVLGPIDLAVRPGEVLFVVGGNGSGKTTLVKLLTGLYTPEAGELRLNGRPVTRANVVQYRELFSVVFADVMLFDRLLGLERHDVDERARAYLQELHLAHKVTVTDGVFSTVDLSKGQRKRLALLVAYLEDRPVYVFDEWAADQDPTFKKVFYTQIIHDLKARGKAVIVVSHDDHYFHVADRMLVLYEGQVVEGADGAATPADGRLAAEVLARPGTNGTAAAYIDDGPAEEEDDTRYGRRARRRGLAATPTRANAAPTGKGPAFLGIGARHAGTTWLQRNLRKHPGVWLPPVRELHYWDAARPGAGAYDPPVHRKVSKYAGKWYRRNCRRLLLQMLLLRASPGDAVRYAFGERNDRWYANLFPADRLAGEITPEYMELPPEAVADIYRMNPALKAILLLRDPVDRAWSTASKVLRRRPDFGTAEVLQAAGRRRGKALLRTDYVATINTWRGAVGEDRLFIGFYDDLVTAPRELFRSVLEFLGLPAGDDAIPADIEHLAGTPPKRPMPPAAAAQLGAMYLDQLRELEALVGGHAAAWRAAAEEAVAQCQVTS